jgi:hypothetical protein
VLTLLRLQQLLLLLLSVYRHAWLASHLDEGAWQEETVSQTDLHATQQRSNASAVCWQVAQVAGHLWGGGDGGLQHTHEWIAIHWLDGGGLHEENTQTL